MLLQALFHVFDDFQEFCYVLAQLLKIPAMLDYCKNKTLCVSCRENKMNVPMKPSLLSKKFKKVLSFKDVAILEDMPHLVNNHHAFLRLAAVEINIRRIQRNISSVLEYHESRQSATKTKTNSFTHLPRPNTSTPRKKKSPLEQRVQFCHCQDLHLEVYRLKEELRVLKQQVGMPVGEQTNATQRVQMTQVVPPPPPPPPPLLQLGTVSSSVHKLQKLENKRANKTTKSVYHSVDMAFVLKGLKDVKLRPIARSPGGTPLRKNQCFESDDPVNLIKAALKKRFESIHPEDDVSKEDSNTSWENNSVTL